MMHQGVTVVIDKWKKVIKRVLSVQDITVLKPIGEGTTILLVYYNFIMSCHSILMVLP